MSDTIKHDSLSLLSMCLLVNEEVNGKEKTSVTKTRHRESKVWMGL